jgi:hypothetical protein
MAPRFLTILTGRNVPKIGQPREPEPSTINEKTIADFTCVVEQTQREPPADKARPPELMPSSYGQPSRAPRGRAQRRNGGWRGRASAVALSKPVMKYLSNGATLNRENWQRHYHRAIVARQKPTWKAVPFATGVNVVAAD